MWCKIRRAATCSEWVSDAPKNVTQGQGQGHPWLNVHCLLGSEFQHPEHILYIGYMDHSLTPNSGVEVLSGKIVCV